MTSAALPALPSALRPDPHRLRNGLPRVLARPVPEDLVWQGPSHHQQHHPANPDIQRDVRTWQVAVMDGPKAERVSSDGSSVARSRWRRRRSFCWRSGGGRRV